MSTPEPQRGAIDWKAKDAETMDALRNPQVGDRFHEMYSWWVYVVAVDADQVVTMLCGAPCTFPDDAEMRVQTKAEFLKSGTYPSMPDKPCAHLADRGNDVSGWVQPGPPSYTKTAALSPRSPA